LFSVDGVKEEGIFHQLLQKRDGVVQFVLKLKVTLGQAVRSFHGLNVPGVEVHSMLNVL